MISTLAQLVLTLAPQGGQRVARRNAWSAMAADSARARARREAEVAMAIAQSREVAHAI